MRPGRWRGSGGSDARSADEISARLAPLPVAALRLDEATVLLLNRLGLKRVEHLARLPREALVRRFRRIEALGANPVLRLDQATGKQRELLVSEDIAPPLLVARRLAEPLGDAAGLAQILADLCGDLQLVMEQRHVGARGLVFSAYRVDGEVACAQARTGRASRDTAHLAALFDGKLDRIDPVSGSRRQHWRRSTANRWARRRRTGRAKGATISPSRDWSTGSMRASAMAR